MAQVASIEDFSPKFGPFGTEITVLGENLDGAEVSIGSIEQEVLSTSTTSLSFRLAPNTDSGPISLTNASGTAVSERSFLVERQASEPQPGLIQGAPDGEVDGINPSGQNQEILIALVQGRWLSGGLDFAAARTDVLDKAAKTETFWNEASFDKTSFDSSVVGTQIFSLPKSHQYYYHVATPRRIQGTPIPTSTTLTEEKTLTIKNNGGDVEVTFSPGTFSPSNFIGRINAAITMANSTGAPPTITASLVGASTDKLEFRTTVPRQSTSKIEVFGSALSVLGLGSPVLFDRNDDTPAITLFSKPIAKENITFAADTQLVVETQGPSETDVDFAAGDSLTLNEVVQAIEDSFPGSDQQQPFVVRSIDHPDDPTLGFLVFETEVRADHDDGFLLKIDGSARETLGFTSGGSNINGELKRYEAETFRGHLAVQDGFVAFAETLPAGTDLRSLIGSAGMLVAYFVDFTDSPNFRAHQSSFGFNILGESFQKEFFADRTDNTWRVFSHETGHALGLPDLYRVRPDMIGTEPQSWDMMDCSCDSHPVSFLKSQHHRPPENREGAWIEDDLVTQIQPPLPGGTKTERFILMPTDAPWSTAISNPFATTHPGVRVTHAVEFVPTTDADVLVLETRAKGPFQGDLLGEVSTSTALPRSGVIMYQGRRLRTGDVVRFLPVNLLTPLNDPLDTIGEEFSHTLTLANSIQLRVIDVLDNADSTGGVPSKSYLIEAVWGEGSFFDVEIRDWTPPPWESVDIWLDSRAENDWDVYTFAEDEDGTIPVENGDRVAVGQENRIYSRIRNLGDVPITDDLEVIYTIVLPQRVGENQEGGGEPTDVETEIGRVTITGGLSARGAPGSEKVAPPFIWMPRSSHEEHVCIRAYVTPISGERNETLNNKAQENITQWYSTTASPFEPVKFEIITEAPWSDRPAPVIMRVPDIPFGWSVEFEAQEFIIGPAEVFRQSVIITPDFDKITENTNDRIVPKSFHASIEATTIVGDSFVTFGGTTAIVHPVNEDTRLALTGIANEDADARPNALRGELKTDGPLPASVTDRAIDVRFRPTDGHEERWVRTRTETAGIFVVEVPEEFLGLETKVEAFYGGGDGLRPVSSETFVLPPH